MDRSEKKWRRADRKEADGTEQYRAQDEQVEEETCKLRVALATFSTFTLFNFPSVDFIFKKLFSSSYVNLY